MMNNKLSHKCVLILIEDSEDEVELLKLLIKNEKINVEILEFFDGEKAYEHLSKLQPSRNDNVNYFVVLDLNLPGMNGREILQQLRKHKNNSVLHIIIFSGSTNPLDKTQCLSVGAKSYYTKPWDFNGYKQFIKGPFLKELQQACPNI